jgi:hypothetical protein
VNYSHHTFLRIFASALTLLLQAIPLAHAESLVYVTIEPKEITMGETARLTITNLGTDSRTPTLPKVSGLQFVIVGHTHQFEMSNGVTLPSSSVIVQVTPLIAGTFTIPPITPNAPSLVLNVKTDHGPTGSTGPGNTNYLIRPPVQAIPPKRGVLQSIDGAAFVRLNLPKRDVYVGESVPVDIQVGARAGLVTALNGLPTLHGGEFTLNNLSHQPDREEKVIDDKHFTVLTWHSAIAAVKPGLFSLDVETPLTVKLSTRPKQDSALDELLGDPFLQNYFGSTVSKEIKVSSPTAELKVLPIPQEGRPADYGGAVGSFSVSSEVTPSSAAAGDPLTLRFHVNGTGNFDRVGSEMFKHLDDWKTYPSKSSFQAADAVGYKGEKTFEQPLIAPKPGPHTVPPLAFSYFDPVARRFQTAASAAIIVNVTSNMTDALPAPNAGAPAGGAALSMLRPDHAVSPADIAASSLVPLYLRPAFLLAPSMTIALFAGGWAALRRRIALAPEQQMSKDMRREWLKLKAAAAVRDAHLFAVTARNLLQATLAQRWKMAAADVTGDAIYSRLGTAGEQVRQLFMLADEIQYGVRDQSNLDFAHWMQIVQRQISHTEAA